MTKRTVTGLTPPELSELDGALKNIRLTVWSYINKFPKSSKEVRRFKALERAVDAVRCIVLEDNNITKGKKDKLYRILSSQIDMFE